MNAHLFKRVTVALAGVKRYRAQHSGSKGQPVQRVSQLDNYEAESIH
jgi:hypothetical protein